MGEKGATHTSTAAEAAGHYLAALQEIGTVTSKKMFGGYGLFESGTMFGVINPAGDLFFRTNETTEPAYLAQGAHRHGKMPYHSVPPEVRADPSQLCRWAEEAAMVAHAHKK